MGPRIDSHPVTSIERLMGDRFAEKLAATPYEPPPPSPPPIDTPWGPVQDLGQLIVAWVVTERKAHDGAAIEFPDLDRMIQHVPIPHQVVA
jgi:hypothetical protein